MKEQKISYRIWDIPMNGSITITQEEIKHITEQADLMKYIGDQIHNYILEHLSLAYDMPMIDEMWNEE